VLRGFLGLFFLILLSVFLTGCTQSKPVSRTQAPTMLAEQRKPTREETIAATRKSKVDKVVHHLKKQLGKPYVFGGVSPARGFDCSGLVFYAYNKVLSNKLPRTTKAMFHDKRLMRVKTANLRQGDLLFFRSKLRGQVDHVGVYLGNNRFIEAPRTGLNIRISHFLDDYWQDHYLGARRILTGKRVI